MTKVTIDKKKGMAIAGLAFEFSDVADSGIPSMIQLIPIGEWQHDAYGEIKITASDIAQFKRNFDAKIRNGVAITAGHEGFAELPAQGWVRDVEARADGLWGSVDWNALGKATLSDKQYKFFSPEFFREYEDPETHEVFQNVLTGGALTKSPYFKELAPIVFSEKGIKKFNENNIMDLALIRAKKVEELSAEEKTFLIAHKEELTEDEKTAFTSVLDVAPEKTPEEIEKETGDANELAGLNRDGSAKTEEPKEPTSEEIAASEKVMISAAELAILRGKADKGDQAFKELRKQALDRSIAELTFNESNKAGKFLPKSEKSLRSFMEGLNETQMVSFKALVSSLPKAGIFDEKGDGGGAATLTTFAEVERRIEEKQKADPKMKYSDALKAVMAEAKEKGENLEQSYDDGLQKAGKVVAIEA